MTPLDPVRAALWKELTDIEAQELVEEFEREYWEEEGRAALFKAAHPDLAWY